MYAGNLYSVSDYSLKEDRVKLAYNSDASRSPPESHGYERRAERAASRLGKLGYMSPPSISTGATLLPSLLGHYSGTPHGVVSADGRVAAALATKDGGRVLVVLKDNKIVSQTKIDDDCWIRRLDLRGNFLIIVKSVRDLLTIEAWSISPFRLADKLTGDSLVEAISSPPR